MRWLLLPAPMYQKLQNGVSCLDNNPGECSTAFFKEMMNQ